MGKRYEKVVVWQPDSASAAKAEALALFGSFWALPELKRGGQEGVE
jgi:hypothetical protein